MDEDLSMGAPARMGHPDVSHSNGNRFSFATLRVSVKDDGVLISG